MCGRQAFPRVLDTDHPRIAAAEGWPRMGREMGGGIGDEGGEKGRRGQQGKGESEERNGEGKPKSS